MCQFDSNCIRNPAGFLAYPSVPGVTTARAVPTRYLFRTAPAFFGQSSWTHSSVEYFSQPRNGCFYQVTLCGTQLFCKDPRGDESMRSAVYEPSVYSRVPDVGASLIREDLQSGQAGLSRLVTPVLKPTCVDDTQSEVMRTVRII